MMNRPSYQTRPAAAWTGLLVLALLWGGTTAVQGQVLPHHAMEIQLDPADHRIEVRDRITLPQEPPSPVIFHIHAGLDPQVETHGAILTRLDGSPGEVPHTGDVPTETYRLTLPPRTRTFSLSYRGRIHHPVNQGGAEYAGSFGSSPGLIGPQGVFLGGASRWYPDLGTQHMGFDLDLTLPPGWRSVSQGRRTRHQDSPPGAVREHWEDRTPQEEIYLVASRFSEYSRAAGEAEAMVFLRRPDPALAGRYLEATQQYLAMYERLIGPYAYPKFALVENFWETGYGMPSFTLLGSRVIRLPFIVHSSYPHEILHNWWGNGVYVDYATGNWSEGLTAYLADHLIKEQRDGGAEYRRTSLQRYVDYVRSGHDFPLSAFRSRHSAVTQAVGYGKTLMLFHMLRLELGDPTFTEGLRHLYRDRLYQTTSFDDVCQSFSAVSGRPLKGFFDQWIRRTGAPALRLEKSRVEHDATGFRLTARIEQTQPGPSYRLRVPVAVTLEGKEQALQTHVDMDARTHRLELRLPERPLRLDVDPEFDLFRRLDRAELPPALGQAFGAESGLIVVPSTAPAALRTAYLELAQSWRRGRRLEIVSDSELQGLPQNGAVWILGWENRFRPMIDEALGEYDFVDQGKDSIRIMDATLAGSWDSVALVTRNPHYPEQAIAWIATRNPSALPGLTRKLPHYGKYSYLGFRGDAPDNILKGQWPVANSPLSVAVVQSDGSTREVPRARLAPRSPLAEPAPPYSATRMHRDIAILAAPRMAGRGLGTPELDLASEHIAQAFQEVGLEPGGEDRQGFYQIWTAEVGTPPRKFQLRNVVGILPGARAGPSVVLSAHYDHLGRGWPDVHRGDEGKIHPGAPHGRHSHPTQDGGHPWAPSRTSAIPAPGYASPEPLPVRPPPDWASRRVM